MADPRLQRKYLRAPLKSQALYVDDEHVFKARILNISEGGVLLSELPHVPEINSLPVAIKLIEFPKFSTLSYDQILNLTIFLIRLMFNFLSSGNCIVHLEVLYHFKSSLKCSIVDGQG